MKIDRRGFRCRLVAHCEQYNLPWRTYGWRSFSRRSRHTGLIVLTIVFPGFMDGLQ